MKRLLSLVLAVSITATTSFAHNLVPDNHACDKPGYIKLDATLFTYSSDSHGYQLDSVYFYITSNGLSTGTIKWDTAFLLTSGTFEFYAKLFSSPEIIFGKEYTRSYHNGIGNWGLEWNGSASITSSCLLSGLPVLLTNFNISKADNNKVLVRWTTTSEQNNSHFIVQGSTDGLNFTDIGMVFSYTESGYSSVSHDYTVTLDNTVHTVKTAGLSILAGITLILIVVAGFKRKTFPFAALALILMVNVALPACAKSNAVASTNGTYKFIRLQQVDKDGTVTTYDTKTVS